MIGLMLVTLSSIACGFLTTTTAPRPGHWEGEPSVSFDVTSDGNIRNFRIVAPFGVLSGQYCTIEIDEVLVEQQGEFTIGEPSDSPMYITGKFTSDETFAGTYVIAVCKSGDKFTVVLSPEEEDWSAEWKEP